MIRLLTGATLVSGRLYRPESGAFSADKETESYLISRGVAVKVDGAQAITETETPAEDAPTEDAPVIEAEAPAPTVEADAPKKPAPKKGAAKK